MSSVNEIAKELLKDHVNEIAKELLKDHRSAHDNVQMECFIVQKGNHTKFAQYRQALRELDGRQAAKMHLDFQRRRLVLDIRDLELRSILPWGRARRAVDLEERRATLVELDKTIAENLREHDTFVKLCVDLREAIGPMSDERRGRLEQEMWTTSIEVRLQLELLATGRVSQSTLETLLSLSPDVRATIIASIEGLTERLPYLLERGAPSEDANP